LGLLWLTGRRLWQRWWGSLHLLLLPLLCVLLVFSTKCWVSALRLLSLL
jgi:hypothetical protein